MELESVKILLVEDNVADADLIAEILAQTQNIDFELVSQSRLRRALDLIVQEQFDVILLDLSLPDSQGLDTLAEVKAKATQTPIIILTALNDENTATEAVRQGAQDYLIKGELQWQLLTRAIRYAIERQRIEETIRQQAERESLMGRILERIRQSLDLQSILQATITEVRQFLEADGVFIYRCKSNSPGSLVVEAAVSNQKPNLPTFFPVSSAWSQIRAVEDINQLNSEETEISLIVEDKTKAFLTIPIWQIQNDNEREEERQSQQPWGLLVAHNHQKTRHWQSWKIDFLKQLSQQLTIAIHQSELYSQLTIANQKLKQIASIDALTDIANRRQFEQVLDLEWQRLARENQPLSLIMCDIDNFKLYNDTYGHPAGDNCLKKVARALQQSTKRAGDLVARYGGEEFVLILPNTYSFGAFKIAQDIQKRIEEMKIINTKSSVSKYVTLSLGIATKIPHFHHNPIDLIAAADRALYEAKLEGRNKIKIVSINDN